MRNGIVVVGGAGNRSGVPSYIRALYEALKDSYEMVVVSDINEGGFDFLPSNRHREVPGLCSSKGMLGVPKVILACAKVFKAEKPSIVWANSSFAVAVARMLQPFFSYRLIVTYHGVPFGPGRGLLRNFIAYFGDFVTSLISKETDVVISKRDMQVIRYSSLGNQKVYIPNAMPAGVLRKDSHCTGPIRIVMTTRDCPQKNLDLAASIACQLADKAEIHVFGSVSDDRRLELLQLSEGRLTFLGVSDCVENVLCQYELYLMTSRYEGFPIGALEALSSGLAIAMTDVGGAYEVSNANPFFVKIDEKRVVESASRILAVAENYRSTEGAYDIVSRASSAYSHKLWVGRVKGMLNAT